MGPKAYKRRIAKEDSEAILNCDTSQLDFRHAYLSGLLLKAYKKWVDARSRCNNPNHILYPHYGGRGLKVSISSRDFLLWFIEEYKSFYSKFGDLTPSLSRKDYNLGYEIGNIELVSISENTKEMYGRRGNPSKSGTLLDIDAVLTCYTHPSVSDLAKHFSVTPVAIRRLKKGLNRKDVYFSIFGSGK